MNQGVATRHILGFLSQVPVAIEKELEVRLKISLSIAICFD